MKLLSSPLKNLRFDLLRLFLLLTLLPTYVISQNRLPEIRFDREVINMDTINEVDGFASVTFKVYNDGNAVLRLLEVQAACGCTSEEYTQDPIAPQDSGFIRITYDPVQRPGKFSKYVSVKCNDPERIEIFLQIQGFVRPRPLRPDERFPHALGSLLFKEGHRTFGTRWAGESGRDTFSLYNTASQAVRLIGLSPNHKQKHIRAKLLPNPLLPGQEGKLVLTYNTRKRQDYGVLFDSVFFLTDDPVMSLKALSLSVNIKENFPSWSAKKRQNAPLLKMGKREYRFGTVKAGTVLEASFRMMNEGREELIVRKISSSCDCLEWTSFPERIQPGESYEVKVRMDTDGLTGLQHKLLTIIVNDPEYDQVFLRFIGNVN